MEDIKISAEFDWLVKSAIQSKLDGWEKVTDEMCEGYTHMKANRDFVIESYKKILEELNAWKFKTHGYDYADLAKKAEVKDIMDAKRDLVEANGGWADVSDAVVVKEGE